MSRKAKTTTASVGAQTETAGEQPAVPTLEMTYGEVPLDLIDPNPEQPRVDFAEAELAELAESIKTSGVIQPIVIQALPTGRYIIHDGERRLRASRLAGLERIPANIILSGVQNPQALLLRAIVANDQRQDLSSIERAKGYQRLADTFGLSDGQIATQVGKSRSVVANTRRLLQLPAERQAQVATGDLNERQALALLPLYALPEEAQKKMLDTYYGKDLLKPEKLTSDDIRQRYNQALSYISHKITFDPGEGFAGEGIHRATCTGCEFYAKSKEESLCVNNPCLDAKTNIIKRNYIASAAAKLGLPYIDPDKWRGLQASQFNGLYSSDTLSLALKNNCSKIHLACSQYGSSPDGFSEACYVCFHQAKGCDCRKAIEAKEKAKEKGVKQEVRQVKDKAVVHLAKLIQDNHPEIFRAILYTLIGNWNGADRALALLPEKVMVELAKKMIESNANPSEYRLATNEACINEWLTKMSLPTMSTANLVTDLDRQLARIEGWLTDHPERPPVEQIKAIRGNLTNLAHLGQEVTETKDPALIARFDTTKAALLVWLEQVEALATAERQSPTTEPSPEPVYKPLFTYEPDPCPKCGEAKVVLGQVQSKGVKGEATCHGCQIIWPSVEILKHETKVALSQFALAAGIATARTKLTEITTWLAKPDGRTNQKLLNRGMQAGDIFYDIQTLIRKHGKTDELAALLAEAEAAESACSKCRLELGAAQEVRPEEVAA